MQDKPLVAFVGLGAMGSAMAGNLVRGGVRLRGFDLSPAAMDRLAAEGGGVAASAAEAAQGADVLILMVVNAAQAEAVLVDGGALAALAPGAHVVLMATCLPDAVRDLAARVAATGRVLVDAPVSGGVVGAQAASLTIMVGAEADALAAVRPLLELMGQRIFHVGGAPGQGAAAKAVNQLLCGVHLAAAGEALSMAEAMGLDLPVMLDIVSNSAAGSWMLRDRGPRMIEDTDVVTSAVDIFAKDLGIVLDVARAERLGLPLSAAAHQMFLAGSGRGEGKLDDSQVIRSYRALAGRPKTAAENRAKKG
ncbi:NAD(P)-dependent oxidoreductase [Phaeovulum vinaykumarii]|uniref:3-hydroxyisobutyrate dehydrogenase n=1 Tax=Phaeovulum vinaykumarii TaxID=407234 RepID=A0A1N7M8G9_9RHOB|nr:NAD(P)-dependent oxidoreductase [Phaeovulum vinaykumarii]SIS82352.1 3-hydroxyisobutyrate dehydrogenase [Phaeovulum vinaykumarii]SOC11044.1 3-hydroxyisobutyrate dehydrogenase [Phaeovulum vinaykumarii]